MSQHRAIKGRLPSGPELDTSEDFARFSAYLKRLLVSEPLGLEKVLDVVRSWIGCDVLLLMSRVPGHHGTKGERWSEKGRALREGVTLGLDPGVIARDACFQELLEAMIKEAKAIEEIKEAKAAAHGWGIEKATAINDWQAPWLTRSRNGSDALKALKQWEDLEKRFPSLARVCIGLLGHVVLGDRSLGETLLVAVNEMQGGRGAGDLEAAHMRPGFVALCMYLSELNSHYYRKKLIDEADHRSRDEMLNDRHTRQAYIRSICRLAPRMKQENIGAIVGNLARIQWLGTEEDDEPDIFNVEDARKALKASPWPAAAELAGDAAKQRAESAHRCERIDAMYDWSELLVDVQDALYEEVTPTETR